MDGLAAARTLTAGAGPFPVARAQDRGRFVIGIASPQDEPEVRRMLREAAFPGAVRLSFLREPDSRIAAEIEGDVHQILVAREQDTGRVVAMAGRSLRDRFVNGTPARVGYFNGLRIAPHVRRRRDLLNGGFALCQDLHRGDGARLYLASVIAENEAASRVLERGRAGWPAFRRVDHLVTLAIPVGGRVTRARAGVEIASGRETGAAVIASVLDRNNRRYQFAPRWTADDLTSLRTCGLDLDDCFLAVRHGRVVGCAALWDQRAFKQVVVRGYSRALAWWRPLINRAGAWCGVPALPPVGAELAFAHLSHLAVDDDDPDVTAGLVAAARRQARVRNLQYVTLGLSSRSRLCSAASRFPHRKYSSILYAGFWPDGQADADSLDGRPAHPEMAVL